MVARRQNGSIETIRDKIVGETSVRYAINSLSFYIFPSALAVCTRGVSTDRKEDLMLGRGFTRGAVAFGAMLIWSSLASAADAPKQVTFSKDVAPILQAKCQECHQPNSIAPMSLITFQDARPWARSIKERVADRQMPPWHIDRSVGVQKFKNDMSLSDEQVDTIVKWVDQGAL
jgi:mono/diheme cytochrome c family protein